LEVFVNNKSAVVNEAVIVDGIKNIIVYIAVACREEDSTLDLELVFLPLLLLDNLLLLLRPLNVPVHAVSVSDGSTHS